ncbi:MAG: hypothetical protein ABUS54_06400 [Actinomycetota bacterium]
MLCAAQAVTVLLPRGHARTARSSLVWVAAPAVALGVGVLVLRVLAGGPHALTLLAAVATPLLALLRSPVAVALWLVAWLAHGMVAQLASVALIALAAVAIAELAARVASRRVLLAGLVVLAMLDVVLVWGTPQVEPASNALHAATVGHGIPQLQDATFWHATMGWLDLVAPALLGVAVARRARASLATGAAAGLWGLLFFATSTLPATVPVLAGMLCASV